MPGSARAAFSKPITVQRRAPAGGAEHASAVIRASALASYRCGRPGRGASNSAACTPPARYALRVRQIAVRSTPSTSMIVACGVSRSSADRMCARFTSRAWCSPFERTSSTNCLSLLDKRNGIGRMPTSIWER